MAMKLDRLFISTEGSITIIVFVMLHFPSPLHSHLILGILCFLTSKLLDSSSAFSSLTISSALDIDWLMYSFNPSSAACSLLVPSSSYASQVLPCHCDPVVFLLCPCLEVVVGLADILGLQVGQHQTIPCSILTNFSV